jgi:hypothetical protein
MALEQLPVVCFGGGRSGADQRMGHSEVEDAKTGGVEPMVSAVVVPMSRKARDMGHPRLDGAIGRQDANGRPGPPGSLLLYASSLIGDTNCSHKIFLTFSAFAFNLGGLVSMGPQNYLPEGRTQ